MITPITPFQQVAFGMRDFPLPEVMPVDGGFVAFTVKPNPEGPGFVSAEFIARSPEAAVDQLARLIAQAPSKRAH